MTPDAAGWRSSDGYARVSDMSASDLAWEWLRRNEAYDQDFQALRRPTGDRQTLIDEIRRRWGLRFPHRSADAAG